MAYADVFSNSFETGIADGTDITIANSDDGTAGDPFSLISPTSGSIKFDSTHIDTGSKNAKLIQSGSTQTVFRRVLAAPLNDCAVGFYSAYSQAPTPAVSSAIIRLFTDTGYAVPAVSLNITSANKLQIIDNVVGTNSTSGGTLTPGNSYMWRFRYNAGTLTASACPKGSPTAVASVSLNVTTTFNIQSMVTGIQGASGAATGQTLYMDNLKIGTGGDVPRIDLATPPVAAFTTAVFGRTVIVDASTSTASAGIASYSWDMGDGAVSTGVTTTYQYATVSTFTITLTVTDAIGATNVVTHNVTTIVAQKDQPFVFFATASAWTPVGGTNLAVLADTDNTTFTATDGSSVPSGTALEGYFGPVNPIPAGVQIRITLGVDFQNGTSATVNAQLFDFDQTTQRSALASPAVVQKFDDVSDAGFPGTGTRLAGSIYRFTELVFPAGDTATFSPSAWDRLGIKLQFTAVV